MPEISDTPAEEVAPGTAPAEDEPEIEVFYTFTWAGRGARRQAGGEGRGKPRAAGKGKAGPRGKPGKGKPQRNDGPKSYSAKPKKEAKIDPDNPFAAALMGLKDKS